MNFHGFEELPITSVSVVLLAKVG